MSVRIAEPDERTLPRLLARQAARHGERPLIRWGGVDLTVADVRDRAAARAGALAEAGIGPGDRVAVLSENRPEVLEVWLGCAWLGAVFVPINTGLRGAQLEHVLRDAAPRALALERALAPLLPAGGPTLRWPIDELPPPGPLAPPHPAGPGDPAALLYTSGTTGPSKPVRCPHAQWYWWGVESAEILAVDERSVLYTNLPLFHTNALNTFVQALLAGAVFALGPRFSASRFWARAAEAGATHAYLLGAMVPILLRRPPSPLDPAHDVRIALAPATPPELHEPFRERFGVTLVDGWGSTETNFVLANPLDEIRPGMLGIVRPEFEARVDAPDGEPGELLVRSREPFAFSLEARGWFRTGDRVVRDADGWFRFVDRLTDSIRRRGENISSWEVEQALLAHPDVAAAAVVPVPSELAEDEVLACVVPREGSALDPADLLRFCEPRLARFALPRYVDVVGELPLTANGKVEKFRLRERGVTERTWDREARSGST